MPFDRDRFLEKYTDRAERALVARILDKAEAAKKRGEPQSTDFLDPSEQEMASDICENIEGIFCLGFGGYRRAERRRMILMPDFYLSERVDPGIGAVYIRVKNGAAELEHRDYLGSLMSLGVKRERFGDLLVQEDGCQVVLDRELIDFVISNLEKVGSFSATAEEIELDDLLPPPERVVVSEKTVASLRLDAVASAGFNISRTKMAQDIKAKRVKLNWRVEDSPNSHVKKGDLISIRGRGRLVVEDVVGETKKGRIKILLKRYI